MNRKRFKFGDIIQNDWCTPNNPYHRSIFIRHKKRTIECTDGKGEFWETIHDSENRNVKIGTIFDNPELMEMTN